MNEGDVATPVIIAFLGPATNPKIMNNTTGEFIKVNTPLLENEKLIIETTFGKKIVEIEDNEGKRRNAFNWIDLESSFWQMIPGENEIEYKADQGQSTSSLLISWKNCYLSV